jgi:hypothetical protein
LDGATSDPQLLASTEMRYAGITWGHDGLALLYERDWKKRQTRTWVISPNQIKPAKLLLDRNLEDSYSDPGVPLMRRTEMGTSVLVEIDKHAQLLFYGEEISCCCLKCLLKVAFSDVIFFLVSRIWGIRWWISTFPGLVGH